MAFVMFGTAVFGTYATRFDGTVQSAITLFAVLNGDVMRESFLMAGTNEPDLGYATLSQLYLYVFCFVFMYVACMITVAIMEEAFVTSHPFVVGDDGPDALAPADGVGQDGAKGSAGVRHRLPFHVTVALDALDELDKVLEAAAVQVNAQQHAHLTQRMEAPHHHRRALAQM